MEMTMVVEKILARNWKKAHMNCNDNCEKKHKMHMNRLFIRCCKQLLWLLQQWPMWRLVKEAMRGAHEACENGMSALCSLMHWKKCQGSRFPETSNGVKHVHLPW